MKVTKARKLRAARHRLVNLLAELDAIKLMIEMEHNTTEDYRQKDSFPFISLSIGFCNNPFHYQIIFGEPLDTIFKYYRRIHPKCTRNKFNHLLIKTLKSKDAEDLIEVYTYKISDRW